MGSSTIKVYLKWDKKIRVPYLLSSIVCLIILPAWAHCQKPIPPSIPLAVPTQLRVDLLRYPERVYARGHLTNYALASIHTMDKDSLQYTAINSKFPGFTWVDPPFIKQQTAFQIMVASSEKSLQKAHADIWNSEKVYSGNNINIKYGGPALQPGTVYFWQVRVWGKNKHSAYSAIQAFRTSDSLSDYALPSYVVTKTRQFPVCTKTLNKNILLHDFGKDGFSQPWIEVDAEHDDSLTVRLGEMLSVNGFINSDPPGTVRYREIKLALRKGQHTYAIALLADKRNTGPNAIKMPAYIGEVLPFRYLEIMGNLKNNRILQVCRDIVHVPFDNDATQFTSSDSNLNRVWELCKYTIQATSFTGYYVDGDRERIPYEADALINQLSHYSSDAAFNMAKRTLDFLIYHPTWPTEWSLQNPLIAYYDYMYSGDLRNLVSIYTDLKSKTLTALQEDNGLISTRTGKQLPAFLKSIHYKTFDGNGGLKDIVDWPHTEKETDGFVFTDYNAVVNAFYYRALLAMAAIAKELQKPSEARLYQRKAEAVRKSFIAHFMDPASGLVVDGIGTDHRSLHANMFALAFGLVPKDNIKHVLRFIKSRRVSCSVYGAQFLLEALGEQDRSGYALRLLTATNKRSWINMLQEGATMTMEAWGQAFKPNQDWNHAWGTAPANYIVRHLMGIRPAKPGFKAIRIQPHPGTLGQASIKYSTVNGVIQVDFQKAGDRFKMQVMIPGNTTATIYLPFPDKEGVQIMMDGRPVNASYEDGYWIVTQVSSGKHLFMING